MEDSQVKTVEEQRNEELIQEMLRGAKPQEIESELSKNPIIHKGSEDQPAPMVVNQISSAGYVYVWDTETYDKVPVLYYMLPRRLRERRKDGSYRFTTIDPKKQPKRGSIKCMLHRDSPNRKHYAELGFAVCPKETINSQYQLEQHMKKRHPQEWAAIEKERLDIERTEDRALQRLILSQMVGKQTPAPVEPAPVVQVQAAVKQEETMYFCTKCNQPHMFTSKTGKEHIEYKGEAPQKV